MRRVHRRERVRFTADQMFDLVNDVDAYPQFLNWCRSSSIERVGDSEVVATMKVGLGGLHRSITTRNTFKRPEGISMEMVAGPFRDLTGNWRFEPAHGTGCIVALELEIQLSTTPFDMMFAALFEEMVNSQVSAFVARAKTVYAKPAVDQSEKR